LSAGALYVSHDDGETWQVSYDGQVMSLVLDPAATPATAYITNMGVYETLRSADSGASWIPADQPIATTDAVALGPQTQPAGVSHTTRDLYQGNASVTSAAFIASTPQATLALPTTGVRIKLSGDRRHIRVTVHCRDGWGESCQGSLLLGRRGVTLGHHSFNQSAGKDATIRIRLSRAARALLRVRPHEFRARLLVTTIGQDRTLQTDHRRVTIVR
jgi:hypothetical protein